MIFIHQSASTQLTNTVINMQDIHSPMSKLGRITQSENIVINMHAIHSPISELGSTTNSPMRRLGAQPDELASYASHL